MERMVDTRGWTISSKSCRLSRIICATIQPTLPHERVKGGITRNKLADNPIIPQFWWRPAEFVSEMITQIRGSACSSGIAVDGMKIEKKNAVLNRGPSRLLASPEMKVLNCSIRFLVSSASVVDHIATQKWLGPWIINLPHIFYPRGRLRPNPVVDIETCGYPH